MRVSCLWLCVCFWWESAPWLCNKDSNLYRRTFTHIVTVVVCRKTCHLLSPSHPLCEWVAPLHIGINWNNSTWIASSISVRGVQVCSLCVHWRVSRIVCKWIWTHCVMHVLDTQRIERMNASFLCTHSRTHEICITNPQHFGNDVGRSLSFINIYCVIFTLLRVRRWLYAEASQRNEQRDTYYTTSRRAQRFECCVSLIQLLIQCTYKLHVLVCVWVLFR